MSDETCNKPAYVRVEGLGIYGDACHLPPGHAGDCEPTPPNRNWRAPLYKEPGPAPITLEAYALDLAIEASDNPSRTAVRGALDRVYHDAVHPSEDGRLWLERLVADDPANRGPR